MTTNLPGSPEPPPFPRAAPAGSPETPPSGNPAEQWAKALDLLLSMGREMEKKDPERACDCFRQAADLARSLGQARAEGRALHHLGSVELQRGRTAEAETCLERSLDLARSSGDALDLASCLNANALIRQRQGRTEEALTCLRESLARTTESGIDGHAGLVRAETLELLGPIYRERGDPAQALRYYQEALELRRAAGDEPGIANDLNLLGNLRHRMGQFQEAISYFRQALELRRALDDRRGTAVIANNLAATLLRQGEFPDARELLEESRRLFAELGEPRRLANVLSNLGLLESLQGRMEEAEAHYLESLRLRREIHDPAGEAISLNNLSNLCMERGRPEEAIAYAEESVALYQRAGSEGGLAEPLFNKGQALLELGRIEEARAVGEEALRAATRTESAEQRAEALWILAAVLLAEGDLNLALTRALEAVEQAELTGDPKLLAGCGRILGAVRLERGELEEAKQALAPMARVLRGHDQSYQKVRILAEEGRLLERAGSAEAAAERFRRAEQGFARLGNSRWRIRILFELSRLVQAADPAQAQRILAAAEELARSDGLAAFAAEQRRTRRGPQSTLEGPVSVSAGLDALAASLLAAWKQRSGEVASYLDPFFLYLRRERRISRGVLELSEDAARRWNRSGSPRSGAHYRVERGRKEDPAVPRSFADFTSVELGSAVELGPAGSGSSELNLRFCSLAALEASDEERETPGHQLTLEIGLPPNPLAVLMLERAGGPAFTAEETQVLSIAGRVLAMALEGVLERLERIGVPELEQQEEGRFELLIGRSKSMRDVYRLISQVAPSETNVLILGESGTGKELAARSIHVRSLKREGPFLAINCPSIPRELIESELFGHERGAFTGAIAARPGKVELADGGTLFLDEVGDMALPTQAKLLRFLQEREFQRVGGRKSLRVNVRVLAATSRDLAKAMEAGEFREDLFYRLNVVPIRMPSLKERREDIPQLVEHFLKGRPPGPGGPLRISGAALEILSTCDWPGNVRELRNTIEYMTTLCEGDIIEPRHLPPVLRDRIGKVQRGSDRGRLGASDMPLGFPPLEFRPGETLESRLMQMEAMLIRATLEAEDWNQSAAARRLGITESKVRNRMRQYGIQKPPGA